jgi:hypothetical protein
MSNMFAEKGPWEEPPAYESDAEAGANARPRQRIHKLKKTFLLALVGATALLLGLFKCGFRGSNILEAIADHMDFRKRRISTGSQSLSGEFDLLDLLSVHSTSGSLNIGIHPQPADKENRVPAEVSITSQSGSINVKFPTFGIPEREYHVSISSQSGGIDGSILHGRRTSLATRSGSMNVRLQLAAEESDLRTENGSGSQDITVLNTGKRIKAMSSTHSSTSGSLALRYPREWEGMIEGHTQSGSSGFHGGGVDVIRRSGHYVLARKGNGNSTLRFRTGSGSVNVYFD